MSKDSTYNVCLPLLFQLGLSLIYMCKDSYIALYSNDMQISDFQCCYCSTPATTLHTLGVNLESRSEDDKKWHGLLQQFIPSLLQQFIPSLLQQFIQPTEICWCCQKFHNGLCRSSSNLFSLFAWCAKDLRIFLLFQEICKLEVKRAPPGSW